MGGGQSTEEDKGGFRIFKVNPGSPASEGGLEVFFDFIVEINGTKMDSDQKNFFKRIQEAENVRAKMVVYNIRSHTERDVYVTPRRWSGSGLLGAVVRYDSLDNVENQGIRVLEIFENSPAEAAGLVPFKDFLLGTTEVMFRDLDELQEIVTICLGKTIYIFVYNSDTESIREVAITPSHGWGGEGALGADIRTGLLHRIPAPRRPLPSEELPPLEPLPPPPAPGPAGAASPAHVASVVSVGVAGPLDGRWLHLRSPNTVEIISGSTIHGPDGTCAPVVQQADGRWKMELGINVHFATFAPRDGKIPAKLSWDDGDVWMRDEVVLSGGFVPVVQGVVVPTPEGALGALAAAPAPAAPYAAPAPDQAAVYAAPPDAGSPFFASPSVPQDAAPAPPPPAAAQPPLQPAEGGAAPASAEALAAAAAAAQQAAPAPEAVPAAMEPSAAPAGHSVADTPQRAQMTQAAAPLTPAQPVVPQAPPPTPLTHGATPGESLYFMSPGVVNIPPGVESQLLVATPGAPGVIFETQLVGVVEAAAAGSFYDAATVAAH